MKGQLKNNTLKKGDKTRLKLNLGAINVLKNKTFKQLRIADICKKANVSYGSFYHYYKDKMEITHKLVEMFLKELNDRFTSYKSSQDLYQNIFATNYYFICCHNFNSGLLQVLISNHEDMPEMLKYQNDIAYQWHLRIANGVKHSFGGKKLVKNEKLLVAYSLGGMLDEILRNINILNNFHLKDFKTDEGRINMAEVLSIIWYRAMRGQDPKTSSMKRAKAFTVNIG